MTIEMIFYIIDKEVNEMKQYLDMCQYILENGQDRDDRTGTGTRSVFGYQTRYDLTDGFPLLTTKKMFLRPIAEELLWFIKGDTNIKYLVDRNVKIWNEWPYEAFKKSEDFHGETLEEFVAKIKELPADDPFVVKYGELGPVYGRQWLQCSEEWLCRQYDSSWRASLRSVDEQPLSVRRD